MAIVVYNGYTLPNQFGKFSFNESYTNGSLSTQFIITASSEAALVTACDTAETALREWNKDLTLTFSSTLEYSFSHSSNTGFLAKPSLSVITNRLQTGTSRAYKFSVSFQYPADQAGYHCRQSGKVNLSQDIKGRKILSVSGVYTACGIKSAYDNYTTYGETWANSIASGLGTFELLSSNSGHEQEDKILNFSFRYQEKLSLAVTYNGYTIPGSYNNFTLNETYTTLSMSFTFAVSHASASAAEVALRIYNADLTVSFNGSAAYSYKHSDNTGLLTKPTLRKISNVTENDNLRFYSFALSCQLPADKSGYGYRREGNISTSYSASRRRTITFSGTYTAGGSNTALQNYNANASTWMNLYLTSFGGTFEKVSESPRYEQESKILNFSCVYRELLTNDSKTSVNVDTIINANCNYRVNIPQTAGYSEDYTQVPLTSISVSYNCVINNTLVSADTDIEDIYRDTVRPWLVEHAYLVLGLDNYSNAGTNYVIQRENYSINPHNFGVSGQLTFMALENLYQIIEVSERISVNTNLGVSLQKIWDGKPYTYNKYITGAEKRMTRSITVKKINEMPFSPKDIGNGYVKTSQSDNSFVTKQGIGSITTLSGLVEEVFIYTASFNQSYTYMVDTEDQVVGGAGYHDPRT